MLQEKSKLIAEREMELSSHYKSIKNSKGTEVWIGKRKYLSIGKNGTDIMIRGNGIVVAFDDWDSFINAIDCKKAVYCYQEKMQEISTDKRC